MCGDPLGNSEEVGESSSRDQPSLPSSSSQNPIMSQAGAGWSFPIPWTPRQHQGRMPFSSNTSTSKKPQAVPLAEPCLKRTIPFVTLSLDHTERNLQVESTEENVYVKIPESSVELASLLSEAGKSMSTEPEDLVILDSKLIPVSQEGKGISYAVTN